MGAWGKKPFENDDALDFMNEIEAHANWQDVREEFELTLRATDYLEAPDGSQAVAGAALVASSLGKGHFLPDEYADLLKLMGPVPHDMVGLALLALQRVRGNNSELNELWSEGDGNTEYAGWLQTLADIETVLKESQ